MTRARPESDTAMSFTTLAPGSVDVQTLRDELQSAHDNRRRAECMATIQTDAVQLALDLLVREPDVDGFFREFMARVVDDTDSHGCGVWLLNDDGSSCELWMAYIRGQHYSAATPEWPSIALPRQDMAAHLHAHRPGWTETIDYRGDDPRLPAHVHAFNREHGHRVAHRRAAGAAGPDARLGDAGRVGQRSVRGDVARARCSRRWLAKPRWRSTITGCSSRARWKCAARRCSRSATASPATSTTRWPRASRRSSCSCRRRSGPAARICRPRWRRTLDTAVELARTHMIEARRSVSALRPQSAEQENVGAALERMTALAQRTSGLPVRVTVTDAAAVRRRRRTRDHRHRPGGADQRGPPLAGPPIAVQRRGRARASASGCRWPTTAADSPPTRAAAASA